MKAIFYTIFLATIFLFSCGDDENDKKGAYIETAKKELTILNQQYDSVLISADTSRLSKLYAPEFSYTTTEGQIRNRQQQLTNIASGGLKLEYGKSDEVEVMVYDSTAILTGRFIAKGTFAQSFVDIKERYTTVWTKKDGKWMLVKEQGTLVK
jgi:hypothetical protein